MPPRGSKKLSNGLKMHWVFDASGKRHYVPVGTDPSRLLAGNKNAPSVPYSDMIAEAVCDKYQEGLSIRAISNLPGMPPYNTIFKWMRTYPIFGSRMREARNMRAFHFENKALEEAEGLKDVTSEQIQAAKVKIDTFKWAAEVNNREVFGKSTKITGDANAPLSIVVDTGIHRDEDEVISDHTLPVPPEIEGE